MIKFFRHIRRRFISEGKTKKYVLYAIGEIILVVIGILIALQINTWNTEYDNKRIISKNSKTLIDNLEKDCVYIINVLNNMTEHKMELLAYEMRLSKPTGTIDTVIKIARYEFRPRVQTVEFPNENAYKTMLLSGEINLFDRVLTQDIYDFYSQHEFLDKVSQENFERFGRAIETYTNSYSFNVPTTTIKGHLQDELWQHINAKDLIAKFNKLLQSQRVQYGRQEELETVLKETSLLILKLRKYETND
jgi:hypothetical protein